MSSDIDRRAEKIFKKHKELLEKKQRMQGQLESVQEEMKNKGYADLDEVVEDINRLKKEKDDLEENCTNLLSQAEQELSKVEE